MTSPNMRVPYKNREEEKPTCFFICVNANVMETSTENMNDKSISTSRDNRSIEITEITNRLTLSSKAALNRIVPVLNQQPFVLALHQLSRCVFLIFQGLTPHL